MSVSYGATAAVSSPHVPLPLDPLPQTLQELIQQKDRWSPTPKSYFGEDFGRNASQSPSPSPVKRRRVGKDVRQRELDATTSANAFRETVRGIGKIKESAEGWGLDEEVASVSTDEPVRTLGEDERNRMIEIEQDESASYEMDNDPTKMVTTGETYSNEEPDMMIDRLETSPPLLDPEIDTACEPYSVFEPLSAKQSHHGPTSVKQARTVPSVPSHVSTKRQVAPLSPKHVNVPDARVNRSFLRDEVGRKNSVIGEENVDGTQERCQVESLPKSRVSSITKPKASNTPDVFCNAVDEGINQKLPIGSTKTLNRTVSTQSVKATFVKPALPSHSSLRGPLNTSETLRSTRVDNFQISSKKLPNTLNAKPSVFYDAPTENSRAIKRTASTSLMDTTLSASASRDSGILSLRKKRRVEGSVGLNDHVAQDTGVTRGKDRIGQGQSITSKQPPQRIAERHQLDDYKKSYTKAFPSFIFLFEIDADKAQVRKLKDQIKRLGGTTEEFLSKKVTHYITAKNINPAPPSAPMPQKAPTNPSRLALVNSSLTSRRTLSSRVGAEARSLLKTTSGANATKESMMSPYRSPVLVESKGASNVALQAQLLGCKVWSLSKLERVLSNLIDPESHTTGQSRKENDLSALLEDERLHGTRERDFLAKRPDWHYFQDGTHFLLVEDALGDYRPILTKVYDKPAAVQDPSWPSLYNTFLKPSRDTLTRAPTTEPEQLRDRAIKLWVKREPYGDEKPPPLRSTSTLFDTALMNKPVTRSVSMNNIPVSDAVRYQREDSLAPYAAASGNSVVLTSNIASTTSQRHSHIPDMSLHGIPDYGKDKRIVQMNRRVQLLKGKASAHIAEQKQLEARKVLAAQNMTYGEELAQGDETVDGDSSFVEDRSSSRRSRQDSLAVGNVTSTSFPRAASSLDVFGDANSHRTMDETVRAKVLEILEESRKPCELSLDQLRMMKRASKRKIEIPRFDLDGSAKPGYCENCRTKYDSFEEHCESRRHRKFAENPENFVVLDRLLRMIRRPEPGATYVDYNTFPPPLCPYQAFLDSDECRADFGNLENLSEEDWEMFKDYCSRKACEEQGES